MHLRVRSRLLLWLLAATFPIFGGAAFVVYQVEQRITSSVERDLENLLELEAARINNALTAQEIDAGAMAQLRILVTAMDRLAVTAESDSRDGRETDNQENSLDSFAAALADNRTTSALRNTEDVLIVDRSGTVLGRSPGFSWEPFDQSITVRAMEERRVLFGNAFRSGVGDDRMGLVVPVVANDGSVLGALLIENRLGPVIDLLNQHEGFGETSEAVVTQLLPDGQVGLITLRRFERDAAFNSTLVLDDQTPAAFSLQVTEPEVVHLVDYRGEKTVSAVQRIALTGWGLTIKIDDSEAHDLSDDLNRYIILACGLTVVVILLGWLTQVRPLGRRLRQTVDASARLSGGDYVHLIGDRSKDEIGDLARRIDGMATDLEADRQAREQVELQLRYQANHDTLTQLINRQRATSVIEEFGANQLFSLLFLDVDGFKHINDSYGHAVGDQVLVAVASRLNTATGMEATWARWGGDEFLAILAGADREMATDVAAKVRRSFGEPVQSDVGRHTIGASIGVATSGEGRSPSEVLHEADVAMFRSKRNRGAYDEVSSATMRLVDVALNDHRVEAAFQPVVRLNGFDHLSLHGAEALVRIRNEDGSIMSPAEFLPTLGASEVAAELDARVAEIALEQLGRWQREDVVPQNFRMAMNLGAASMADPQLTNRLGAIIGRHGIRPSDVLIEIPETVEVVRAETVESLRRLGVSLAIDDVGCQYSNLERMVDINADVAKLDRRWIPDLATVEDSTSEVLRGLVGQCRALGLDVIAEGVETDEQLRMLRNLGIDVFQGYLFGRPVSAADFERNWRNTARLAVRPSVS